MSSRSLARLFRAELKMSFQEWRSQLLLLEAQIRLAQGQSSSRVAKGWVMTATQRFARCFARRLVCLLRNMCGDCDRLRRLRSDLATRFAKGLSFGQLHLMNSVGLTLE